MKTNETKLNKSQLIGLESQLQALNTSIPYDSIASCDARTLADVRGKLYGTCLELPVTFDRHIATKQLKMVRRLQ